MLAGGSAAEVVWQKINGMSRAWHEVRRRSVQAEAGVQVQKKTVCVKPSKEPWCSEGGVQWEVQQWCRWWQCRKANPGENRNLCVAVAGSRQV